LSFLLHLKLLLLGLWENMSLRARPEGGQGEQADWALQLRITLSGGWREGNKPVFHPERYHTDRAKSALHF
jgi:hypothetical protein